MCVEGPTDLAILQAFGRRFCKEDTVSRPFVHYVGNQPRAAAQHYFGLKESLPGRQGVSLFDRLQGEVPDSPALNHLVWQRREIENYFCTEATLKAYARASASDDTNMPLFVWSGRDKRLSAMREAISEVKKALETLGKDSPWDPDLKVSDEFLKPLFRSYFAKMGIPNLMNKKNFYELADHVPDHATDPEISLKLDEIVRVANLATPAVFS